MTARGPLGCIRDWLNRLVLASGFSISRLRPARPLHKSRFEYQRQFVKFDVPAGSQVLDIGSGADPFPLATVLAERYLGPTEHRHTHFKSEGKPAVVCDIHHLPFKDGVFDYVYCSHVLEHVHDPVQATGEIIRVGKKGYIETPHYMTDALFGWAQGMHRWFVQSIDNRLVFFEYDRRRAEGVRSMAWHDTIFGKYHHPLQDLFADNKDIFTVMFPWQGGFDVDLYFCDGTTIRREHRPPGPASPQPGSAGMSRPEVD